MSLTALPVSTTDIQNLETGIQFTLTGNAATEAAAINAATPGGPTVFSYGVQLLASNISLSQVAMADSALMEGVTVAAGTGTGTTNTLALFTTQFLPAQVQHALAFGFNPTVYAAESLGLALADNASFQTNFVSLSIPAFALEVSNLTGVNTNAIERFVTNWENFYTGAPGDRQGVGGASPLR